VTVDTPEDRLARGVAARRVRVAEELVASTARALCGVRELRFRGHVLHDGRRPGATLAPHLRVDAEKGDLHCLRGAADGVALQLLHCDARIHAARRPDDRVARLVYDQLEQFRVESLAAASRPGVRRNLSHRFRHWLVESHDQGLTGTASGLLLHTLGEVTRARVNDDAPPPETERVTEAPRYALAPLIGHELVALRRHRHDQRRYGEIALALAEKIAELLGGEPGRVRAPASRGERALAVLLGGVDDDVDGDRAPPGMTRTVSGPPAGYRAFTTTYDRESRAGELARRELLEQNRARLDELVACAGLGRRGVARMLEAELTTPTGDGWDHARDAGRVDGRRLPALVTTPGEHRVFSGRRTAALAEAHVTLLLDCSGSMKAHASFIAVFADVLARTLEDIDVPCAVLGFTTRSWNGGRARRAWRRAGYPDAPGRVAEALHLVFADDARPWRRSRLDLAALLKPDLFREGLDGEAVAWAAQRTRASGVRRRILLVASDGGPAESATDGANEPGFLDGHLAEIVEAVTRDGVEVIGLGLGSDVSAFYPRSLVLDASVPPTVGTFCEVAAALRGRR
jgi:cobaltochelatase CobT